MSGLSSHLNEAAPCFPTDTSINHGTPQNLYGAACGMCGRLLYVDQETLRRITYATQSGLDNPLRCDDCEQEYDDLAFEG